MTLSCLASGGVVSVRSAAAEFLGHERIAVTGVSRTPKGHSANVVYRRLRDRGYTVFPINPNADEVEGDVCFHDLTVIDGGCPLMFGPTATVRHRLMRCTAVQLPTDV